MIIWGADRSRIRIAKWHGCCSDDKRTANLRQLDALAELVGRRHGDVALLCAMRLRDIGDGLRLANRGVLAGMSRVWCARDVEGANARVGIGKVERVCDFGMDWKGKKYDVADRERKSALEWDGVWRVQWRWARVALRWPKDAAPEPE